MNRKVKVVQIGCGNMGTYLMKYAIDKGAQIVGAFDTNPQRIDSDISTVIGGNEVGVAIKDIVDLDEVLKATKPDCAIVATRSLMRDVMDLILTCVRNGVNVVTTCDEAVFPWNSSPAIAQQIDQEAKKNNCTVTGSGFPDLSYCHLTAATAGGAHSINKILGSAMYNVDDYGIALAEHHGAGLSAEAFEKEIASVDRMSDEKRAELIEAGDFTPIPMWNCNGWICSKLGLTVEKQIQERTPIFAEQDLESKTLNRVLKKGEIIGMTAKAITHTVEGITLETESIGKVYSPGEADTNNWAIIGDPDIYVKNAHIKNTEMICSLMVSRIIDVINGPAGFVTTDNFNPARYVLKPLNEYITNDSKNSEAMLSRVLSKTS